MDDVILKALLRNIIKRNGIDCLLAAVDDLRNAERKDTLDFWESYCQQERSAAWDAALKGEMSKEDYLKNRHNI